MADTTENIDEILAYLVSPEYLRMAADQQGEWNWQNAADPADLLAPEPVASEGLADWEREILESEPLVPIQSTPDPVQHLSPTLRHRFGIEWDTDSQTCVCRGCRNRRRVSETPSLVGVQRPVRLRSRSDAWHRFADVVDRRMPFTTSTNSLRGTVRPESGNSGQLRSRHAAAANLWTADQRSIDYVIYSYQTPIAWHVTSEGVSEWIYPNVKYSPTTSQHQAKIRNVLDADSTSAVRYLQPEE